MDLIKRNISLHSGTCKISPTDYANGAAVCARNVKRTLTPDLNCTALTEIQHKSCFQSNSVEEKINTLFPGLGRSVLGKTAPLVLSRALGLPRPRPANNIYRVYLNHNKYIVYNYLVG